MSVNVGVGVEVEIVATCTCGAQHRRMLAAGPYTCACGRDNEIKDNGREWIVLIGELKPKIDTSNKWGVSSQRGKLGLLFPQFTASMSNDDALLLAAWLVSMVGDDDRWKEMLEAVQSI